MFPCRNFGQGGIPGFGFGSKGFARSGLQVPWMSFRAVGFGFLPAVILPGFQFVLRWAMESMYDRIRASVGRQEMRKKPRIRTETEDFRTYEAETFTDKDGCVVTLRMCEELVDGRWEAFYVVERPDRPRPLKIKFLR